MDRELHPAETQDGAAEDRLLGGALPDDATTRDGEALPSDEATPPQPPESGGALPDPTEATTPPEETGSVTLRVPPTTTAATAQSQRTVDFAITHPSQTRFVCPDCKLAYTSHNSLARHVGVSHSGLKLNISFKCALCDYTHASLKSTSCHFCLTHGAAVPPVAIAGSNEKWCPYCPRTFPSTRSCSMHIREQHMEQASAQRA